MIIEQVDSLDEQDEVVLYKDLKIKDAFVWGSETPYNKDSLRIRTSEGHLDSMGYVSKEDTFMEDRVIIVDAKIIWAHRKGGQK